MKEKGLPSRHDVQSQPTYEELQSNQSYLEEKIEKLTSIVENLSSRLSDENTQEENNEDILRERYIDEKMDIHPEARIKVISLCPNRLCLTAKQGQRPYIFRNFGEVKRIRYEDLGYIIENHPEFLEDGVFMILDSEVIKMYGLDEFYGDVLTKENFEKILSGNFSDAIKLVENANKRQQRYVVDMLARKIIDGEGLSLDFIDRVSRITGFDVQKIADNSIALRKAYKQSDEKNEVL